MAPPALIARSERKSRNRWEAAGEDVREDADNAVTGENTENTKV
jgi:hypothetical protein